MREYHVASQVEADRLDRFHAIGMIRDRFPR